MYLCTYGSNKISKTDLRPLLDRIDIHIEVPRVDYEKLSGNKLNESSETIRQRVQAAREIQNKRFANGKATNILCNADMRIGEVRQFCQLQDEGQSLMRAAMSQLQLSAHLGEALHASQSSEDHAGVTYYTGLQ